MIDSELKYAINSLSRSVAVDLAMGGDDPGCVAETTLECLSIHDPGAYKAYRALVDAHGYDKVFEEVMKIVSTL